MVGEKREWMRRQSSMQNAASTLSHRQRLRGWRGGYRVAAVEAGRRWRCSYSSYSVEFYLADIPCDTVLIVLSYTPYPRYAPLCPLYSIRFLPSTSSTSPSPFSLLSHAHLLYFFASPRRITCCRHFHLALNC